MKTINKIFFRSFLLQALWNFEYMQGMGFFYSIKPRLQELYEGDEFKDAVMRHLGFFNTHPYMALFILGHCAKREGDKSISSKVKANEIKEFKLRMGGPLAALGDKIFWSTFRPLTGLLAVAGALMGGISEYFIPIGFLVFYNAPVLYFKYRSLKYSYYEHHSIASYLGIISRNRLVSVLPLLGLGSVGLCIAAAFAVWGVEKGSVLLALTLAVVLLRSYFKLSSTTLVYFFAALAVGYTMVF